MVLAAAMLVWGLTLLKPRLEGRAYIIYWTFCFLFTGLALIISLADTFRLRHQMRDRQKELIANILRDVERARREKEKTASPASAAKHAPPKANSRAGDRASSP